MKTLTTSLGIVIIVLLLFGCGGSPSDDYFPLKAGYKWSFQVINGADKTVENFKPRKLGKKMVIPQKVEKDGLVSFDFLAKTKKGLILYATQSPTDPEPVILDTLVYLYKNPFKAGTTWESDLTTTLLMEGVTFPLSYEILKGKETVTVPAGTYEKCIKVVGKGSIERNKGLLGTVKLQAVHTNWFAPGVGFIKSTFHTSGNHVLVKDVDVITQMTAFSKK